MEELREQVKNLKFEYKNHPQKELLITIPNPYIDRDYQEEVVTSEFTTLCPLNPGQPDYATLTITYIHHHLHIILVGHRRIIYINHFKISNLL